MKQFFLTGLFALLTTVSLFAQDTITPESSGEAAVQKMMALMEAYDKYNVQINRDMATGSLYQHRLTLNANSNTVPGIGEYNQSIQIYYNVEGAVSSLKKIIVVTAKDRKQQYVDMTFDGDGQLYIAKFNPNMLDPSGDGSQNFYYERGQVVMYTVENSLKLHDGENYDQDAFEGSVEWLNKAEDFKAIFAMLVRVEPK